MSTLSYEVSEVTLAAALEELVEASESLSELVSAKTAPALEGRVIEAVKSVLRAIMEAFKKLWSKLSSFIEEATTGFRLIRKRVDVLKDRVKTMSFGNSNGVESVKMQGDINRLCVKFIPPSDAAAIIASLKTCSDQVFAAFVHYAPEVKTCVVTLANEVTDIDAEGNHKHPVSDTTPVAAAIRDFKMSAVVDPRWAKTKEGTVYAAPPLPGNKTIYIVGNPTILDSLHEKRSRIEQHEIPLPTKAEIESILELCESIASDGTRWRYSSWQYDVEAAIRRCERTVNELTNGKGKYRDLSEARRAELGREVTAVLEEAKNWISDPFASLASVASFACRAALTFCEKSVMAYDKGGNA